MNFLNVIISLSVVVLGKTAEEWLNEGKYGNLSDSVMLGKQQTEELLNQIQPGEHYALVLPTNKAWKQKQDLYNSIKNSKDTNIYNLLTLITVQSGQSFKSANDFPTEPLPNMAGHMIKHTKKNGEHYISIGYIDELAKFKPFSKKPSIKINEKPSVKLDQVDIFSADEFDIPAEIKKEIL